MDRSTTPGAEPAPPRYCPRCRVDGPAEGPLCRECGETLRDQGYCPICEGFWKLDPGAECPKHDVELIDEAPRPEAFDLPGERASLVTVATYSHPNQANAPRIRLEAEGIPTFLDGERIAGNTLYQVATGGVRLQVPVLARLGRPDLDRADLVPPAEADDDLDDAWDELAPEPGSRRRAIMKLAILVILFGPIVVTGISMLAHFFGQ